MLTIAAIFAADERQPRTVSVLTAREPNRTRERRRQRKRGVAALREGAHLLLELQRCAKRISDMHVLQDEAREMIPPTLHGTARNAAHGVPAGGQADPGGTLGERNRTVTETCEVAVQCDSEVMPRRGSRSWTRACPVPTQSFEPARGRDALQLDAGSTEACCGEPEAPLSARPTGGVDDELCLEPPSASSSGVDSVFEHQGARSVRGAGGGCAGAAVAMQDERASRLREVTQVHCGSGAAGTLHHARQAMHCSSCGELCLRPVRCGTCKVPVYCNATCQQAHWKEHRKCCRQEPHAPKVSARNILQNTATETARTPKQRCGEDDAGTAGETAAPSRTCVRRAFELIDNEACTMFSNKTRLSEQDVSMLTRRCAEVMEAALNRRRECGTGERGGRAQRSIGSGKKRTEREVTTVTADQIVENIARARGHEKAGHATSEQLHELAGAVSECMHAAMKEWMHAD